MVTMSEIKFDRKEYYIFSLPPPSHPQLPAPLLIAIINVEISDYRVKQLMSLRVKSVHQYHLAANNPIDKY